MLAVTDEDMDWMSIVADDDTDDREKRYSDFDLEYGSKKLKRSVDAATLQLPDRHTHPPLETWLVTRISEEPYSAHLYVLSFRTTEEKGTLPCDAWCGTELISVLVQCLSLAIHPTTPLRFYWMTLLRIRLRTPLRIYQSALIC